MQAELPFGPRVAPRCWPLRGRTSHCKGGGILDEGSKFVRYLRFERSSRTRTKFLLPFRPKSNTVLLNEDD
jgi:hypothetical protein